MLVSHIYLVNPLILIKTKKCATETLCHPKNKGVVKMFNRIMLVAILILVASNIALCVYTLKQMDKIYKRLDTVFYIVSDDAEENYKFHKAINSKLVETLEKLP